MSSGAVATQPEIRTMTGRGLQISSTDSDESIRNQIVVFGENDAPDGIALYPATGLYVQVGDSTSTPAQITTRGATANMVLTTNLTEDKAKITLEAGADGDVLVQTDNAGVLQLENTTTDADSVLSIMGNGTGDAKLDLQNASKRVWVMCDENKKLKIMGGSGGNTFILDVSGAATGITFPDGTTQTTAASGGGATELSGLSDVLIDATNWTNGFLIQTNSGGSAPTTGTLSSATNNIGIGADVLSSITTADRCIVFGEESARGLTTGTDNVVIGSKAMHTAAGVGTGTQRMNVAIGHQCMGNIQDGANENIGIGYQALGPSNALSGEGNTSIGFFSGRVTSGDNNLMLGTGSGNITTGSNNVIIGKASAASATADDQLVISAGDGTPFWIKGDSAGSCYQGDNATTWSTTSDRRLKREIVDSTIGLDAINAVRIRNFRYVKKAEPIVETETNEDGLEHERIVGYDGENRYGLDPEPVRVGVIAQEFQEVFPDGVKENLNGHLTVNPDSMNWALIKAVQELSAKVEALEASQ